MIIKYLTNENNYSKFIHIAIVFTITLIIASIFSCIGIDEHHDGIMFKPAIDVAEGKMLFRDTFTQYGALTTLLQAFVINIFGKYLVVIKLQTAFFYAMISVLLWLIWSRFLSYSLVTVSCMIWLLLAPYYSRPFLAWSSVYSLFFLLLSSYWFIIHIEKKSLLFLFLSGASASLAFWCRQPVGVFLFFSLVFVIISLKYMTNTGYKKMCLDVAIVTAGNMIVLIFFFCWLLMNRALDDWYLQSIKLAFVFADHRGIDVDKIVYSLLGLELSLIWAILPLSLIFILLGLYYKRLSAAFISQKNIIIYSVIFISFASWLQYYPVVCTMHTYWAASPMIGLLTYLLWLLTGAAKIVNRSLISVLFLIVIFIYDIGTRMNVAANKLKQFNSKIYSPRVLTGIKLTEDDVLYYEKIGRMVDAYLSANPGKTIITNGPNALCLTFAENKENFHTIYVSWDMLKVLYPDYIKKREEFVRQKKPLIWGLDRNIVGYNKLASFNNGQYLFAPAE